MQNSKIEWTHHTFNIVWGCQRVSPGCQHCYAETLANRYGHNVWGPAKTTERREMSANYWKQPVKWNDVAKKAGTRARVFCGSMCDVFEDHRTNEWARANLFGLIEQTPHLDWLLLTKRPENIRSMLPAEWVRTPMRNIWLGTSCENQEWFDKRITPLLSTPAAVHFLSCEPLLGPIDMRGYKPTWVIAGGESGPGARPMHPDWARSLRDQCETKRIAFFFKQWGEYGRPTHGTPGGKVSLFCGGGTAPTVEIVKVGKHAAGNLLDGRQWLEFPS